MPRLMVLRDYQGRKFRYGIFDRVANHLHRHHPAGEIGKGLDIDGIHHGRI